MSLLVHVFVTRAFVPKGSAQEMVVANVARLPRVCQLGESGLPQRRAESDVLHDW